MEVPETLNSRISADVVDAFTSCGKNRVSLKHANYIVTAARIRIAFVTNAVFFMVSISFPLQLSSAPKLITPFRS